MNGYVCLCVYMNIYTSETSNGNSLKQFPWVKVWKLKYAKIREIFKKYLKNEMKLVISKDVDGTSTKIKNACQGENLTRAVSLS